MAKEKKESYLSPFKVLPKSEAEAYKKQKEQIAAMNYRQKMGEQRSEIKFRGNKTGYAKSRSGRFSAAISSGFRAMRPGGVTQALYRRTGQLPPQNIQSRFKTVQGVRTGKKGRPAGTLDKRYAAYGGVYGYRKILAARLREQRLQINRRYQVSPGQEQVLQQVAMRQQAARVNPEAQIFPDTDGNVNMNKIFKDIMDAANAVG